MQGETEELEDFVEEPSRISVQLRALGSLLPFSLLVRLVGWFVLRVQGSGLKVWSLGGGGGGLASQRVGFLAHSCLGVWGFQGFEKKLPGGVETVLAHDPWEDKVEPPKLYPIRLLGHSWEPLRGICFLGSCDLGPEARSPQA